MLRNEYHHCSEAYCRLRKLCIKVVLGLLSYRGGILSQKPLLAFSSFRFHIPLFSWIYQTLVTGLVCIHNHLGIDQLGSLKSLVRSLFFFFSIIRTKTVFVFSEVSGMPHKICSILEQTTVWSVIFGVDELDETN